MRLRLPLQWLEEPLPLQQLSLQQQVVTQSSLGPSTSETLEKRFPNREGNHTRVSKVPFDPSDED